MPLGSSRTVFMVLPGPLYLVCLPDLTSTFTSVPPSPTTHAETPSCVICTERVPTRGAWLSHKYSCSSPVSGFNLPTPLTVPKYGHQILPSLSGFASHVMRPGGISYMTYTIFSASSLNCFIQSTHPGRSAG